MEQVHRSSIEADNRLRTLETDQRRLELYHQMLNNISTQATLLLGFSLATYAVDLMPKVLDDAGTFCFYKTYASMVCGSLFMLCNTCTLGFCLLVILFSSLLILRSQTALLYVGGAAAVWRTHKLMHYIYMWYGLALANFITNAMLLMWIYLGFGLWHEVNPDHFDIDNMDGIQIQTYQGHYLQRCLDPRDDKQHEARNLFGIINVAISQTAFACFVIYGWRQYLSVNEQYALDAAKGAMVCKREEQEARASDMLQKEVSMAKRLRDDAKRALQHAKRNALLKGLPTDGPSIVRMSVRVSKAEKRLKKAEQRWLEDERLRDPHRIGEDRKGKRTLMQAVRRMKLMLRATANKASSPKKGSPTRAGGDKAMGANAFGGPGTPAPSKSLQDASLMSPPLASLLESAGKGKPADGEVDSLASGRGHGDHNDDVEA